MWNRSVGLFVVLPRSARGIPSPAYGRVRFNPRRCFQVSFFTLIVMWALYDLLTENVFWGDSLAHLLGDSRFSEAFGSRSKEDEL